MGANNFIALATIPAGSATGPLPAVDLFTLVPPSGIEGGFTVICDGEFEGTIAIEGSLDGVNFNPLGEFTLGKRSGNQPLEPSPIVSPDVVRFLRPRIVIGNILADVFLTLGGTQNCACASADSIAETLTSGEGVDPLASGEIVRIDTTDNVVVRARAMPASPTLLGTLTQGTIGVTAAPESGGTVGVKTHGKVTVMLEPGLAPLPNQTIYLSPNVPGRATNIRPRSEAAPFAPMPTTLPLGVIKDVISAGEVIADIGPLYQVFRKESFDFQSYRTSPDQGRVHFAGKMSGPPSIATTATIFEKEFLVAIPFVIPVPGQISGVRNFARDFEGTGDIRVGIYTNKPNSDYPDPANDVYPFRLLMQGIATVSAEGVFVVGTPIRVVPGLYWMVLTSFGTDFEIDALSLPTDMWPYLGYPDSLSPFPVPAGLAFTLPFIFGPLPDPFPPGATIVTPTTALYNEGAVLPSMYFEFNEES